MNLNRYWNKFEELLTTDPIKAPLFKKNNNEMLNTSTAYLMPGSVKMRRANNSNQNNAQPSQSQMHLIEQNNIHDQINTLMTKKFHVEKNFARSSMYKHFNDESLYHGVNLNLPRQRCSCSDLPNPATIAPKYPFSHRNIQLSFEDKENLENEAMEVFTNFGYDISF